MRHVTFGKAAAPFNAGEKRLVPDEVAGDLERSGMLIANEPWPPVTEADPVAARKPARPVLSPKRPTGTADRRAAK